MGARLELKHGLVAEADRIANSADTMLVDEPVTGSKSRTKGNLYLVVSSAKVGGRAREATILVADTIRREYYYDESAGIPICLEKAVRAANRKLRGSREGGGLPPGAIGIAVAVVRQSELYVATIGDAEAYLVRAARLLMPDQTLSPGIPADDALRVDVWRGELAVGDSLLLVSRNLTQVVGTEELKNAVVTLHPQSAVEHLHHLFVAAGGDGSDSVVALEATELAMSRSDRRPVPEPGLVDPYGDLPGGPIPGGDAVAGAAGAVSGAMSGAAGAVTGAFTGAFDRVLDLMPRRAPAPRQVQSSRSRRETQRRAALALLGLLAVVFVLGVAITVFPRGSEDPVQNLSRGEIALATAMDRVGRGDKAVTADPDGARKLYQEAWTAVQEARAAGVLPAVIDELAGRVTGALDDIYNVKHPHANLLLDTSDMDPRDLIQGPDKNAYIVDADSRSVWSVERGSGDAEQVVKAGDKGIGVPRLLAQGFVELVILDDVGGIWRWRPAGAGTLQKLTTPRAAPTLGDDISTMDTLLLNPSDNVYNLYMADPSANQIYRYASTLDGRGFSEVTEWLATDNEDVSSFRDMYVDGSVYTLTGDNVIRHYDQRVQEYELETPPDDADLRPGHEYRFIGESDEGTEASTQQADDKFFVYDAKWKRILGFRQGTGEYLEQWQTVGSTPPMADVRGMYVIEGNRQNPATIVWLTGKGLYVSPLVDDPDAVAGATPAPVASGGPQEEPTKRPPRRKSPTP